MINLRQRLIVDYSSLKSVAQILSDKQSELILLFFTMAVIFEFFDEWNFIKVLKRIVVCFVILAIFDSLFKHSINLSFSISDSLLDKCKNTEFCSHYLAIKGNTSADSTLLSETTNMIKNFSSFWLHALVSLIFKLAFVFTIQIYSLVHAITSITYPLICSIGILPSPGEKAFVSLFQTLLWLFISPIILSTIIVLLASVTEVGIGPKGEVGLEGILHLMIISLFSLGSLFLSWLICKGEGVAAFGSKMSQMGATVLAMGGVGGMMNMGRGAGGAVRDLGGMASSLGKNKVKNQVSNSVSKSIQAKGLEVGASDIANSRNNPVNSPLVPKGTDAYKSLSKSEKLLHSFDSVINSKENSLAKQGMIRDFKKVSSMQPNEAKFKVADYKDAARKATSASQSFNRPVQAQYKSSSAPNRNKASIKNFNPRNPQVRKGDNFSRTNNLPPRSP